MHPPAAHHRRMYPESNRFKKRISRVFGHADGLPFEARLEQPARETIAAMLEAERIAADPDVKHYSDVEEALRELKR